MRRGRGRRVPRPSRTETFLVEGLLGGSHRKVLRIDQLVEASEADADLGFMARLLALCSLPRTNPGDQKEYIRRNGPYTLGMSAGINNKLPYGNLPRLLLAWVCTEAVRTQNRELILGRSLADFMRSVGVYDDGGAVRRRLRNQMQRLFRSHVELVYEDEHGSRFVNSAIADSGEFWWDAKHPDQPALWESKIDRTSCCRFWANQRRVLLTAAAYVLMQELRLRAARTACARAHVTWLRDRLLTLGAHVVGSVRRVVLHLPTATPDLHAWRHIALALGARAG